MSVIPSVSVIIPLKNKGKHIGTTIKSVLNQTIQDFEIVIIDGNSTDNGLEIAQNIVDSRINIYSQKGTGVSNARNQGVISSQAEFIAFLDADDEWSPNHLETLLRLQGNFPEAGSFSTSYSIRESVSSIKEGFFYAIPEEPWEGIIPNFFHSAAFGESPLWTSVVGMPKKVFLEAGGFDETAWWGEDTDLWARIALRYPVAFSWDGEGLYNKCATNRACKVNHPVAEINFVGIVGELLQRGDIPANEVDWILEFITKIQLSTAWQNIISGRTDLARRNLKKCSSKLQRNQIFWLTFLSHIPHKFFFLVRYRVLSVLKRVKRH